MALVDRVKNILLTPKTEWEVIERETTPTASLITGYVLPLAGVAALATFIGYCLVGTTLPFVGTCTSRYADSYDLRASLPAEVK